LVVLWLEIIVYFGLWVKNAFVEFQVGMGEKFHASIALILGYLALQGIYSGLCSRFELEMMFFTLSLLMSMIWPSVGLPFGVKGVVLVIVTKPEFWFQVFMWCCYWSAPRLPILIVCAVINIYGLCIGLFHLKPMMGTPEQLEKMLDEADPEMKSKLQKIGVVFAKPTSAREPLMQV